MTTITAHRLTFRIGNVPLVDDVSLVAEAGDLVAIVGANGAGKSTLLRLLSGDLHPTQGEVRIDGHSIRTIRAAELARFRAVLPQRSTIEFSFTVHDVVAMGRNPLELTANDCMSRPVCTVEPDADLNECCDILEHNQVRRVLVVDGDGCCCGIVSQADLARHAPSRKTAEVVKEVSQPAMTA